ncbi:MAG: ABC transporter substrate-binding protein [Firmicutes bacterium]|nr:ABC transporter substrate-binding protein [Bacillota bacterium]
MMILLVMVMAFSACGPANPGALGAGSDEEAGHSAGGAAGSGADPGAYTFGDDLGREVTVAKAAEGAAPGTEGVQAAGPERVAALIGSFAQIWTLAGGEVHASADDAWDEFGLAMAEDAVNLGNTKELSLEKLFSAEPDFIIASANTRQNVEWKETLEALEVPVAYFRVSNFDEYLHMLKICTEITGRPDLYAKNGEAIRSQIEAVKARAEERLADGETGSVADGPKVLSMRASASFIRAKNSQDNVLGEILKDLGCINIADSDGSLLENLSIEHILEQDPDYIFFVQQGDDEAGTKVNIERMMKDNPAWQELTAVKEGRVYFMDKALYGVKPNHRWGEAYEIVEEILENGKS